MSSRGDKLGKWPWAGAQRSARGGRRVPSVDGPITSSWHLTSCFVAKALVRAGEIQPVSATAAVLRRFAGLAREGAKPRAGDGALIETKGDRMRCMRGVRSRASRSGMATTA